MLQTLSLFVFATRNCEHVKHVDGMSIVSQFLSIEYRLEG